MLCHTYERGLETLAVWALVPVFATLPWLTPKRYAVKHFFLAVLALATDLLALVRTVASAKTANPKIKV